MKIMTILAAAVSSFALAACGSNVSSAGATTAPMPANLTAVHDTHVTRAICDKDGCVVTVGFKAVRIRTPGLEPLSPETRSFSSTCKKDSTFCSCYGDEFCSVKVALQINGAQYEGTVEDVPVNGSTADIRLAKATSPYLLMGDGKIYGEGETVPPLPGVVIATAVPAPKK